ncbi:MAG: hypothetical protein MUO50_19860, partial [Longimicrobiales bacterium]|nr:hypothetical protein [Longimicrobiales bacterium]
MTDPKVTPFVVGVDGGNPGSPRASRTGALDRLGWCWPYGAREAVEIALRSQRLALETRVGMDVEGARQDAFGSGPGFLLAVGTGTMV